jgi:hypothetical protein
MASFTQEWINNKQLAYPDKVTIQSSNQSFSRLAVSLRQLYRPTGPSGIPQNLITKFQKIMNAPMEARHDTQDVTTESAAQFDGK